MTRRLLVIGCGSIGRRHLRNLRALGEADLLAFDPLPERGEAAARETGARRVASIEEGLAEKAEVGLICSPSSLHADQALAVVGRAHLFIEKPVAATYADGQRVTAAVREKGRVCLVGCNLRFHPGILALKRALDEGAIGRPLSIRAEFGQYLPDWHPGEDYRRGYSARRDLGGGILLDAIHEIDLVRWLCGDYEATQAISGRTGSLEIETEDVGLLIGRTRTGVWCEIHLDYLQRRYSRSCRIVGTEGTLVWDVPAGTTTLHPPRADPRILCDFCEYDANEMYLAEMRHFLRCLTGEEEPAQDAAAAAEAVRVVESFRHV